MATYHIYVRSNEHPRTINTPANGRTYYTKVVAEGRADLEAKVKDLRSKGEHISEIATTLGKRIYGI